MNVLSSSPLPIQDVQTPELRPFVTTHTHTHTSIHTYTHRHTHTHTYPPVSLFETWVLGLLEVVVSESCLVTFETLTHRKDSPLVYRLSLWF